MNTPQSFLQQHGGNFHLLCRRLIAAADEKSMFHLESIDTAKEALKNCLQGNVPDFIEARRIISACYVAFQEAFHLESGQLSLENDPMLMGDLHNAITAILRSHFIPIEK
ncbi:MAG: hypothetical protein Q3986_06425 [Akkermansia sp.]|nr:hypothetical protein [Akkermansia sp.]